MDQLFEVFFSAQTILFCLGVYVTTFVVRRTLESTFPRVRKSHFWLEVFVPIGPIGNGALLGFFMKEFTWPEMVGTSTGGRVMFGSVCGLFSSFIYNRIRAFLKAKAETSKSKAPSGSSLPPPVLDSLPPISDEADKNGGGS